MCLTAYFDESGTHENSAVIAFGGFISTPERWERFQDEWRGLVKDEYGLDYFHMAEFAHSTGQFKAWTDETMRRKRLSRLLGVIEKYVIASVGFVLVRRAYDTIISADSREYGGGPYGLLAVKTFADVGEMIRLTGLRGKVAYVFEEGAKGRDQVERVYRGLKKSQSHLERNRLLDLSFKDKRQCLPLQAADILAYELYRGLDEQIKNTGRSTRYPFKRLARLPLAWDIVGDREMIAFERVLSVASQIDQELIGSEPVKTWERQGNPHPVSIEDFQDMWRWCAQFMGLVPMSGTKDV